MWIQELPFLQTWELVGTQSAHLKELFKIKNKVHEGIVKLNQTALKLV